MKKYIVHVKEVHDQPVEIVAKSEEDAIMKVNHAGGKDLRSRFECCLNSDLWTVEEIE